MKYQNESNIYEMCRNMTLLCSNVKGLSLLVAERELFKL